MRSLLLVSAMAVAAAWALPAQAVPVAKPGISDASYVTEAKSKKRQRVMRRATRENLDRGMPGFGPTRDMSKRDGGRANTR